MGLAATFRASIQPCSDGWCTVPEPTTTCY